VTERGILLPSPEAVTVAIEKTLDVASVYEENVRLLVGTAMERFQICEMDAQTLAHEVFLSYFLKADEVLDPRAWLISAIYNASRHFLRTQARQVSFPEGFEVADRKSRAEALPDQLAAKEAFCCLTARCQLALRLRYLEGYSIPEIAAELQTTPKYAGKLVSRCLRQAHDRYDKKGKS
jgi:RNA polymerase sigma factor (sigma-70 family)